MEVDEGWDAQTVAKAGDETETTAIAEYSAAEPGGSLLTDDDALHYTSVTEVTNLLRSTYLSSMFRKLNDYEHVTSAEAAGADEEGGVGGKNAITPDDPEYQYVSSCSTLVLRLEAAKSRVMVFLRAQYSVHFPELAMFFTDAVLYAKVVQLINNSFDLTGIIDALDELVPSQMLIVIIACASTTSGRALTDDELARVTEACQEMENLEMAKQTFLEYIQSAMPLICPNLCAFLGTGITSQLFAITGSVAKLSVLDTNDIAVLGSRRANDGGVALRTTGFLSNCDLVANLPPQLRPKALRLVASVTLTLARIDANRRASSKDEGVRQRRIVCNRIRGWLDPPVLRGAGHNMYERRGRKRLRARR